MSNFDRAQRNYDAMLPPEDNDSPELTPYPNEAEHLIDWVYEKGHELLDLEDDTVLGSRADAIALIHNVDEAQLAIVTDPRTRFLVSTDVDLAPDEQVIDYSITPLSEEWAAAYEKAKAEIDRLNAIPEPDYDLSTKGDDKWM